MQKNFLLMNIVSLLLSEYFHDMFSLFKIGLIDKKLHSMGAILFYVQEMTY